jgi:hypothetical protein
MRGSIKFPDYSQHYPGQLRVYCTVFNYLLLEIVLLKTTLVKGLMYMVMIFVDSTFWLDQQLLASQKGFFSVELAGGGGGDPDFKMFQQEMQ